MADGEHVKAAWRALGRQLYTRRQARGLSQEQLAELIHYSRSSIANVETGRQKVSRRFWKSCDEALATGETFALCYDEIQAAAWQQLERTAAGAHNTSMAMAQFAGSAVSQPGPGEDADQEPIVVALATEAIDLATWAEQTNVGDTTIDTLADAAGRLSRDYLRKPPLPVLRDTTALYLRVSGLLRGGHQSLRQARDLYVIAGQLLAFLSWVSSDVGQPAAAEAHARAGWVMAEQADHDPLRAMVLIAQPRTAPVTRSSVRMRWAACGHAAMRDRPTTPWVFTCARGIRPPRSPKRKRRGRHMSRGSPGRTARGRRSASGRASRTCSPDGWTAP